MLIHSENNAIYERILTAKNGQLVRVRFAVVEVDGVMRGRVISVTPVVSVATKTVVPSARSAAATHDQLCLPASVARDIAAAVEIVFAKENLSPYASFEFFMSQPTRAPAFN